MNYIIPAIICFTIITGFVKKISVYDSFIDGTREALGLIIKLLPFLCSVFLMLEVFEVSGVNKYISRYLGYVFGFIGIPNELAELVVIRPVSGSGSLGVLEKILEEYGADSYIGRCASVICGASDTVFYIVAVYLSESKEKTAPLAIPIALIATFTGNVLACFLCRFI